MEHTPAVTPNPGRDRQKADNFGVAMKTRNQHQNLRPAFSKGLLLASAMGLVALTGVAQAATASSNKAPNKTKIALGANITVLGKAGQTLLCGKTDGSIEARDLESGTELQVWRSEEAGKVKDVIEHDGFTCWIQEGTRKLILGNRAGQVGEITLAPYSAHAPVRLSGWKDGVFVHFPGQTVLVNPRTLRVQTLRQALPERIAAIAEQGPVLSTWDGKTGMIVGVRRFGKRQQPLVPGGFEEISMVTAWSPTAKGDLQMKGAFTCSLTQFQDAQGPKVFEKFGQTVIDEPHGTAALANLKVGREGVIALDKGRLLLIPFTQTNWSNEYRKLAIDPNYSESLQYDGSNAWWFDEKRLIQTSLEDGDMEVFALPKRASEIDQIMPDKEGVWILSKGSISRIEPDDQKSVTSFGAVHYTLGAKGDDIKTNEQRLLSQIVGKAGSTRFPIDPWAAVRELLQRSKIAKDATVSAKRINEKKRVGALQFGDLVVSGNRPTVYVGNGEVLEFTFGKAERKPLELEADSRIERILRADAIASGGVTMAIGLLPKVFPVGINRPVPELGHSIFVRVNKDRADDKPITENQQRLMQLIKGWVGTPYVWAGNTKEGCDCSGFVKGVFAEYGISLPRHSQDIGRARIGKVVMDELRAGDVLVFPNPKHVAIYIGDGRTVEAVRGGVGYSSISRRRLAVVRRFFDN